MKRVNAPEARVKSRRYSEDKGREHEKDSRRDADPISPRDILLNSHHRTQYQHPQEVDCHRDEHQQHQRPATSNAEEAMVSAQPEGFARFIPAVPMPHDETHRGPALLEAVMFQRSELVNSRGDQHRGLKVHAGDE